MRGDGYDLCLAFKAENILKWLASIFIFYFIFTVAR